MDDRRQTFQADNDGSQRSGGKKNATRDDHSDLIEIL